MMTKKKIFVFDIEYAGKDEEKIKPNKQLVKIAKIMSPEKIIKIKDLFTYISLNKDTLVSSKEIEQSYLDKMKSRKIMLDTIKGVYDIELHLTNDPYFKYANNIIYYVDFAYDVLNFEVDKNNKINTSSIKQTGVVS